MQHIICSVYTEFYSYDNLIYFVKKEPEETSKTRFRLIKPNIETIVDFVNYSRKCILILGAGNSKVTKEVTTFIDENVPADYTIEDKIEFLKTFPKNWTVFTKNKTFEKAFKSVSGVKMPIVFFISNGNFTNTVAGNNYDQIEQE